VVEAAYPHVKRLVGRPGVFLLAPPGSSRGYILEGLLREGAVDGAYAYPRLAEELRARGLAVGDLPSAEELERGADRRIVVAVESSLQAVELKEKLGKRAELIYLPKYFKKAAKDVDEELLQVAEVEHRGLGEGISPKLLRPGEAEELKKGKDALLALSPGAVGLKDAAKEALGRFPFKAVSALLVSAVLKAVDPGAAPLAALVGTAVGVGRKQLEDLAARLLELFARGREPRDKVAAGFAKLVRRALEAEPYIDDDRYEAVVDQVALEWGMDVKTFKTLVKNLAALARDELVTKEELSRELAQHVKRGELEKIEETIRHLVESKMAEIEKRLEEVRRRLDDVEKDLERKGLPIRVLLVDEVEAGQLYDNFQVKGGTPAVSVAEGVFRLVETGRFKEAVKEVLRRLDAYGVVVLRGPKGVGKSTLAAYAAWLALRGGVVSYAARIQKMERSQRVLLRNVLDAVKGGRLVAVFDPSPLEFYIEPGAYAGTTQEAAAAASATLEELLKFAEENRGRGLVLAVIPDDLYDALDGEVKERAERYVITLDLRDAEFLTEIIYEYSGCRETPREKLRILAEKIAQFNGGYTLVAKYAGLWLRDNGCKVESVERTVEEAKKAPKLFFAHYIWHVLLRGSGDLAMKAAVPLLLHAYFGPVPVGVTFITKAVDEGGRWRLSTPEGLEGADLQSLKKDALEPIAKWLARRHEDLVGEALRDLAGLNGEETRKPYREALRDLIKALDWARREVPNEGGEILAKLGIPKDEALKVFNIILAKFGIPEKDRELATSLLAFISRRLAAVFKSDENKSCWHRAALIAGHALAGHSVVPKTKPAEDGAEALGDGSESCAVDVYLTTDGEIPPLSVYIIRIPYEIEAEIEVLYASDLSKGQRIKQILGVLTPFADAETIKKVKRTAEELLAKWRIGEIVSSEVFYGLGLATLAAEGEVDGETADLMLRVASAAVQHVTHSVAALPVLAALRPLGEKAPHRYIVALAAASELTALYQETALYIYNTLQQLKNRLSESNQIWPLVEAVDIYSNLLKKHLIINRWDDPIYAMNMNFLMNFLVQAVVEMCSLYGRVKSDRAVAPNGGFSAQHLLETAARASVLAVALENDGLAPLVQRYCNFGDIEKEAEAVRKTLEEAAAHPDELRKIAMNDADFSEWISTRSVKGDAWKAIENLRAWFTGEIALYKLRHALNERGDLDQEKLKQAAKEFEDAAKIAFSSGHPVSQGEEKIFKDVAEWINYINFSYWALKAYILAAKSCEEFLRPTEGLQTPEKTKSFQVLWKEARENIIPTAEYLATTADIFGGYLVCLAASGKKQEVEELLKEGRWLLYYRPEVSIATRLMLKLFGVGEGAKLDEIVHVFWPRLLPEFRPALLMLASRLQRDKALEMCEQLPNAQQSKAGVCVNAVYAAAGGQMATHRLKSSIGEVLPNIRKVMQEAHRLLNEVDGRSLVEVLAPRDSQTQTAFMLLAAVEGRAKAVRLHGLLSSARSMEPLFRRLFRAVYENCGKLDSEDCRLALLKLYYLQF
jgi:hypothetical protein